GEYEFWRGVVRGKEKNGRRNGMSGAGMEVKKMMDKIPADNAIIGYISTGGFSLAQGETRAVGACLIGGLKQVTEDGLRHKREVVNFVLVRGVTGRICRPATFELLA
ncbi:hypothetical protein HK097_001442, partial [Rhizophlyctis rosea]